MPGAAQQHSSSSRQQQQRRSMWAEQEVRPHSTRNANSSRCLPWQLMAYWQRHQLRCSCSDRYSRPAAGQPLPTGRRSTHCDHSDPPASEMGVGGPLALSAAHSASSSTTGGSSGGIPERVRSCRTARRRSRG